MLFNSLEFIFLFLPVTLVGWFAIGRVAGPRAAILWLIAASFVFYAWWNVRFIALLAVSIGVNFWIGSRLSADATPGPSRRMLLLLGIGFNLAILGYFKYANFFVDNIQAVTGASFAWEPVLLPIAISFFTFQKIAFLADAYWGRARAYDFAHFSLFVMFFPQLIAGPIVHHREIIPQIEAKRTIRFSLDDFAAGLTIFAIGLAKKVVVADHCGEWASRLFAAADNGLDPGFFDAWIGALSYTLQIYFDFSAYSDMAVGLARMFGFRMPINFDSPYKAASIIDFWRRWHMTLSRFLRDYLYIPLGGSRRGRARQYLNILVTMFLSGLWHGAGWTFVLWG
ncbi:MAG: MBOAT family protein, partial [Rhodospirillaceae bacterium]